MKIEPEQFRVQPGEIVDLNLRPTTVEPLCKSDKHYATRLEKHVSHLSDLQQLLYADNRQAVLLIFQAMDAAGKDGAIQHVMSGVNPQGCQVFSFKHPTDAELQHDFLWRTTRDLPERGRIGIFNRSYYEEVLIVRVHRDILVSERLPDPILGVRESMRGIWQGRYQSIVDLERHLHSNGTRIIKFFLHMSKEVQRLRFLERIDNPDKNWKFSNADLQERRFWPQYMRAYEQCLSATSSAESPWYIVPADDKNSSRLIVSQIVLDTFESMQLAYPKSDSARLRELKVIRGKLMQQSSPLKPQAARPGLRRSVVRTFKSP